MKAVSAREVEVGDGCDIVRDPFGNYLRSVSLYASDSSARQSKATVIVVLK